MNRILKEKEIMEDLGKEVKLEDIVEITDDREIQKFIYELEDEEYEIPEPIEKFYLVRPNEVGIICKAPVITGEIEEDLFLEFYEEVGFEDDDYDGGGELISVNWYFL